MKRPDKSEIVLSEDERHPRLKAGTTVQPRDMAGVTLGPQRVIPAPPANQPARVIIHAHQSAALSPLLVRDAAYITEPGKDGRGGRPDAFTRKEDQIAPDSHVMAWRHDGHYYHLSVNPKRGNDIADFKGYTRDVMARVEADLGVKLDWIAATHDDVGRRHAHVLVRGVALDQGQEKPFILSSGYFKNGLDRAASDVATRYLGNRSPEQIQQDDTERQDWYRREQERKQQQAGFGWHLNIGVALTAANDKGHELRDRLDKMGVPWKEYSVGLVAKVGTQERAVWLAAWTNDHFGDYLRPASDANVQAGREFSRHIIGFYASGKHPEFSKEWVGGVQVLRADAEAIREARNPETREFAKDKAFVRASSRLSEIYGDHFTGPSNGPPEFPGHGWAVSFTTGEYGEVNRAVRTYLADSNIPYRRTSDPARPIVAYTTDITTAKGLAYMVSGAYARHMEPPTDRLAQTDAKLATGVYARFLPDAEDPAARDATLLRGIPVSPQAAQPEQAREARKAAFADRYGVDFDRGYARDRGVDL